MAAIEHTDTPPPPSSSQAPPLPPPTPTPTVEGCTILTSRHSTTCACTNISIMQLFHELKQQFPTVPDHVVSQIISNNCHDRLSCTLTLQQVASNYAITLYPSPLSPRSPRHKTPCPPSHCPNLSSDSPEPTSRDIPPSRSSLPFELPNSPPRERPSCLPPSPDTSPARPNTLNLSDRPRSSSDGDSRGGVLDLSVNLKCRLNEGVNLTVTTPPSNRPTDFRNCNAQRDASRAGYGSTVHITVSPVSSRPLHRQMQALPIHREGREIPEVQFATPLDSLVWRQKVRLERLERALSAEKARLINMEREVRGLRIPIPTSAAGLKPAVHGLRVLCQRLARQLDRVTSGEAFYDNIYTGQRTSQMIPVSDEDGEQSWQCHVCTFRNHALLNKCEECDMPRIILGKPGSQPVHPSCDSSSQLALLALTAPPANNNCLELDVGSNNTLSSTS